MKIYKFFIVMSGGIYGYFGKGYTLEEAKKAWRKAGGKKNQNFYREIVFQSNLPFAPMDRAATEEEADAWIGKDGSVNWIRCEQERN